MSNPLYDALGQNTQMNGFMQRLNQLKRTFGGDPMQAVQQMLNSGKVSQEQYNRAVQTAQNIQRILNTRS